MRSLDAFLHRRKPSYRRERLFDSLLLQAFLRVLEGCPIYLSRKEMPQTRLLPLRKKRNHEKEVLPLLSNGCFPSAARNKRARRVHQPRLSSKQRMQHDIHGSRIDSSPSTHRSLDRSLHEISMEVADRPMEKLLSTVVGSSFRIPRTTGEIEGDRYVQFEKRILFLSLDLNTTCTCAASIQSTTFMYLLVTSFSSNIHCDRMGRDRGRFREENVDPDRQ